MHAGLEADPTFRAPAHRLRSLSGLSFVSSPPIPTDRTFYLSNKPTMSIDKRWILLAVTAGAAAGAALASRSRRLHHRAAHEAQHKTDLKTWENEGGNFAPAAVSPVQP